MNNENLIPLNKRTQRERKEIARKGAIATNKKKVEQKTYREMAKAMLSAALRPTVPMLPRLVASSKNNKYYQKLWR